MPPVARAQPSTSGFARAHMRLDSIVRQLLRLFPAVFNVWRSEKKIGSLISWLALLFSVAFDISLCVKELIGLNLSL
jgi:hypothetical protein